MNRIRPLLAAVALALLVAACGTGGAPRVSLEIASDALSEGIAGTAYDFFFAASSLPDDVSLVTFEWDFGDGTTGRRVMPVSDGSAVVTQAHTYSEVGEYQLSVTAHTAGGREIASETVTVTIGTDRRFLRPVSYPTGDATHGVAMADLDGDGHLDMVAAASYEQEVVVLWGEGERRFSEPQALTTHVGLPKHAAVADFDGDGCLDIAVAMERAGLEEEGVAVFLSDDPGCRSFSDAAYFAACELAAGSNRTSSHMIAAGDLNGDGNVDLAVACWGSANISILEGAGDGTFEAPIRVHVGGDPHAILIADLDGQGHDDIAVAALGASEAMVLLSEGDFGFAAPVGYVTGSSPHGIVAYDLDGNGHLDLVTANQGSDDVSVLLNDGDGTFTASAGGDYELGVGATPKDLAVGDLNGDGLPDLVVANSYGNQEPAGDLLPTNLSVLYGEPGGTFTAARTLPLPLTPFAVDVVDIDGDGHLDVAVANWDSDDVKILYNSGISAGDEAAVAPR